MNAGKKSVEKGACRRSDGAEELLSTNMVAMQEKNHPYQGHEILFVT